MTSDAVTRQLAHATFLAGKGQWDEAVRVAGQILAAQPENLAAVRVMTVATSGAGDHTTALRYADLLVELAPRNPDSHLRRSEVLRHLRRPADALRSAEEALRLAPGNAYVMCGMVVALLGRGRRRDLRQACELSVSALAVAPESPLVHVSRALVFRRLADHRAERAAYEQALALDPTDEIARHNLALLDHARGRTGLALTKLRDLVAENPTDRLAAANLAKLSAGLLRGFLLAAALCTVAVCVTAMAQPRWRAEAGAVAVAGYVAGCVVTVARMRPVLRRAVGRAAVRRAGVGAFVGLGLCAVFLALAAFTEPFDPSNARTGVTAGSVLALVIGGRSLVGAVHRLLLLPARIRMRRLRAAPPGSSPAGGSAPPAGAREGSG